MCSMGKQKTVKATLICPVCESPMYIARKVAKKKKVGHVKHMNCYKCQCTRGFIEKQPDSAVDFWNDWQKVKQSDHEETLTEQLGLYKAYSADTNDWLEVPIPEIVLELMGFEVERFDTVEQVQEHLSLKNYYIHKVL